MTTNNSLQNMLNLQRRLDADIFHKYSYSPDFNQRLNDLCNAIIDETQEIRAETNWKWWKEPSVIDQAALKKEAIDVLHFLLSLFNELNMDAEEVYRNYMEKNKENHQRQEPGGRYE